ncbi:hypothetical protein POVCU2_0086340 [Plasmodium ovale curtisi]|uniref:Uncharacterized protein n=1 Tax=Plasmodium ovale curtisi TaxID=864141 RepID=A0A1A8WQP1_PLAOA|nr:hypothetical protein POVCU2_0086340 [Plasmodium ovale curtisi]SBS96604.1 hypothetical protein POVCU1_033120 [Plasmodium ovale curtisi]
MSEMHEIHGIRRIRGIREASKEIDPKRGQSHVQIDSVEFLLATFGREISAEKFCFHNVIFNLKSSK